MQTLMAILMAASSLWLYMFANARIPEDNHTWSIVWLLFCRFVLLFVAVCAAWVAADLAGVPCL